MPFHVYVLWSPSLRKTYVGMTSDLEARVIAHNVGTKGWTLRGRPWQLVFYETFDDKAAALRREKYFKSGVGREAIRIVLKAKFLV
ncbi:MAG: GIY-YIG nuclease family protein [Chryseolinea sp.]